jgi:hypothetical protein
VDETAVASRLTKNDRVKVICGVRVFVGDAVNGSCLVTVVGDTESDLECVSVTVTLIVDDDEAD